MKKLILVAALAAALLTLPGCAWGVGGSNGWKGLIPDKDVEITNPVAIIATPWGTQTLKADRIATRVDPRGTNSTGSQALPLLVAPVEK